MHSRKITSLNVTENQPGRSPQVLFLHGVLRNWQSYYTVWPALENDHALMFLDFRGHGDSARASRYLVTDYVDDAVQVLSQLTDPCVVYGHSLGAMVAVAAASRVPDLVRSIILEDPPFETMAANLTSSPFLPYFRGLEHCVTSGQYADSEEMFQALSNTVVGTSSQGAPIRLRDQRDEPTRRFMAEALLKVDPLVLKPITACHWLDGYDLDPILSNLRCPVELLQADAALGGMLMEPDVLHFQQRLGERCRVTYFEKTGHSIHWAWPDRVVQLVRTAIAHTQRG